LCVTFGGARPAHAEPDCPTASEDGQRARDRGKLLQTRDLFRICARNTCPAVVRKDCVKWLAEIEESLPSVVIAARDSAGNDATEVKIFVDGEMVAQRADGKPIQVDPGEHVFRFEMAGQPAKSEPVVIRTGEKNRLLRVELGAPSKPEPAVGPQPQPGPGLTQPEPKKPDSGGDTPVLAYVLGGVGIVALGSFAYFGATSKTDLNNLKNTCAPYCAQDDLDSVKHRMLIADISLGVGIVALGVATYLFVTSDGGSAPKTTGRLGHGGFRF
jgi:hypothetical protein